MHTSLKIGCHIEFAFMNTKKKGRAIVTGLTMSDDGKCQVIARSHEPYSVLKMRAEQAVPLGNLHKYTNLRLGSPVEFEDHDARSDKRIVYGTVCGLLWIGRAVGKTKTPQCRVLVRLEHRPYTELSILEERIFLRI